MGHILLIGGYDTNLETATELGIAVTLFQKKPLVTPMQSTLPRRLFAFDYEDIEQAVALARVVHEHDAFDGVVSFTEFGLETAAVIGQALSIRANPLTPVLTTRDKVKMRELLAKSGIASARYRECLTRADLEAFFDAVRTPLVLKPARGSGSEGVSFVADASELEAAWARSAAANLLPLIAEEYFEGPEVSVESQTVDGNHEIVAITEKITTEKPRFVETGHQAPARLPEAQAATIRVEVSKFLDAIGHELGPAHTELRLTCDGPRIIESQTRPGGDFIWEIVLLGRGVDFVKETFELITAAPAAQRASRAPGAGAAAVRFFADGSGKKVRSIEGLEAAAGLPGVVRVSCSAKPGDVFGPVRSSDDRQGFVLATGATTEEACRNVERAFAAVTFEFHEDTRPLEGTLDLLSGRSAAIAATP